VTTTNLGLPTTHSPTHSPTHGPTHGLTNVPTTHEKQSPKHYKSDQEVRWCPGCGDYIILNTVQNFLPTLGLKPENIVFVSGIGCSSRFPYYLNTYGIHSIHGRAPAIATGLALTRPDLNIWVITGDGDALSIGGNHLIHTLRRNINLTILLFNNRIYGLTKGQYSPTSEPGKITKSTPMGSPDHPFNPLALALGANATFLARTHDTDRTQLTHILTAATHHRGTALIEIYQNCPIFNDGAFTTHHNIPLTHNTPIRFGPHNQYGIIRTPHGTLDIATINNHNKTALITHNAHHNDPNYAFALTQLTTQHPTHTITGILRAIQRPTYDDTTRTQTTTAHHTTPPNLHNLLHGKDTWTVQ
jgi:2-oxoglutarate/2-oxoacid ferredoxin oxidoreductase subunit beta